MRRAGSLRGPVRLFGCPGKLHAGLQRRMQAGIPVRHRQQPQWWHQPRVHGWLHRTRVARTAASVLPEPARSEPSRRFGPSPGGWPHALNRVSQFTGSDNFQRPCAFGDRQWVAGFPLEFHVPPTFQRGFLVAGLGRGGPGWVWTLGPAAVTWVLRAVLLGWSATSQRGRSQARGSRGSNTAHPVCPTTHDPARPVGGQLQPCHQPPGNHRPAMRKGPRPGPRVPMSFGPPLW